MPVDDLMGPQYLPGLTESEVSGHNKLRRLAPLHCTAPLLQPGRDLILADGSLRAITRPRSEHDLG
jgi:hypothetical protein